MSKYIINLNDAKSFFSMYLSKENIENFKRCDTHLEKILYLMQHTTESKEKQSDMLEFYYGKFDERTKKAVNIIMNSVCGYSLDTILNHPEKILNSDE